MFVDPIAAELIRQVLDTVVPAVVVIAVGTPLAVAVGRRISRGGPALATGALGDLTARLQRIEAAIDTMAVEVERISEAQRFAVRLRHPAEPDVPARGDERRR